MALAPASSASDQAKNSQWPLCSYSRTSSTRSALRRRACAVRDNPVTVRSRAPSLLVPATARVLSEHVAAQHVRPGSARSTISSEISMAMVPAGGPRRLLRLTVAASISVNTAPPENGSSANLKMRVDLVINGARQVLVERRRPAQRRSLETLLRDITRDDRMMAAAACGADMAPLARTPEYAEEFASQRIGAPVLGPGGWRSWSQVTALPGGNVKVSAVPLTEAARTLGFVVQSDGPQVHGRTAESSCHGVAHRAGGGGRRSRGGGAGGPMGLPAGLRRAAGEKPLTGGDDRA
jgi:hypothetical protein